MWRTGLTIIAGIILALGVADSTHAGGWAVVTLDALPREVRAGVPIEFGFMVRQHGMTSVGSSDNDFVKPYLIATQQDSTSTMPETIRVDARHEGAIGHFVVDVTFPSAGIWEWEIVPAPLTGTVLEPLTVLAPDAASIDATSAGIFTIAPLFNPIILRWAGTSLIAVAVTLMLIHRLAIRRQRMLETDATKEA